MSAVNIKVPAKTLSYFSSVERDVWSGAKSGSAYEWWYFDALSDDASEAIVVIFLDNFVFSPRYNQKFGSENGHTSKNPDGSIPAVAFTYYRDGHPVYRSIAEFEPWDFQASTSEVACKIGGNSFEYRSAPYGSGYFVRIDLPLSRGRRLRAAFEWLSIESDLAPDAGDTDNGHCWNLVAPRSDVTGRISIFDRKGRRKKIKFRGTGYHDHNSDTRWMPDSIDQWFWGRAHFPLATAVFYRYRELNSQEFFSKLFLVREGQIDAIETEFEFRGGKKRNKFGLRFPREIKISGENIELSVESGSVIDSSFFYLRFLSNMSLTEGGRSDETAGISEYLSPAPLKNSWVNRLIGLRIGKHGKRAFLP